MRNAYRIEHETVRDEPKVSLKSKLRRLSCKTKPSSDTGRQTGHLCTSELGGQSCEREGEMPEKEVPTTLQVVNEFHHLE